MKFIDKMKRSHIIKKIKETKDFNIYRGIKESELKYDTEIMEVAWNIASRENYKEFPIEFQTKKARQNIENLRFCSNSVQKILGETAENISKCNEEMQYNIGIEHGSLLKYCNEKVQYSAVKLEPDFIVCCTEEVRNKILEDSQSPCWKPYIDKTKSFDEIYKRLSTSKIEPETKKAYWGEFFNSRSAEEIENLRKRMSDQSGDVVFNTLKMYLKDCNYETQNIIFEKINDFKMECGDYGHSNRELRNVYYDGDFSEEFVKKKFKLMYGGQMYWEYQPLLNELYTNPPQYSEYIKGHILRDLLTKKTLVEKVEPQKFISYIRYNNSILNEEENKNSNEHCKDFRSIVEEVYGEKALKILESRPGLDWENIPDIEVFSKEVIENFREGFVHDLLSYNFKDMHEFIDILKKPEDLEAFKLYYNGMSQILGENVVTMQMCMSRYNEYSDILKQATQTQLTEKEEKELYELCSWNKNICGITKLDELPMLEEKLKNKIFELSQEKNSYAKMENDEKIFGKDILDVNLCSESIMYNYRGSTFEDIKCLTEEERKTFEFFQTQNYWGRMGVDMLNNACKEEIQISSIFLNRYKAFNKIKEQEMTKFKKEITNREKIEQAIKKSEYEVKRIEIDGVEIIDLGRMPCNFAVHNPNMVNSYSSGAESPKQDQYLIYDKINGISTISAGVQSENSINDKIGDKEFYVYWDFEDNEIVGLVDSCEEIAQDAMTGHQKRMIKSNARATKALRYYKDIKNGQEIAFYRRYRNHARIEKEKYGGKVIPSAIIGDPKDSEIIKISQERFGKAVPILCPRGALEHNEIIKAYKESIKKIKEKEELTKMLRNTYQKEEINSEEIKLSSEMIRSTINNEKNKENQIQEGYR